MNLIEVETRFAVTRPVRIKLYSTLGEPSRTTISDRYVGPELALCDWWLRERNGIWELKLPAGTRRAAQGDGCTAAYREMEGTDALRLVTEHGFEPLELKPYVNIMTVRDSWKFEILNKGRVYDIVLTVDETTADNGFFCATGEVETLVSTEEEIADAIGTVEHVCDRYGLDIVRKVGGSKIIKYLYENDRVLYDQLANVGLA